MVNAFGLAILLRFRLISKRGQVNKSVIFPLTRNSPHANVRASKSGGHPMTPDKFAALAGAVFGDLWRVRLAKAHGVHRTTVHRWGTGEIPIPDNAIAALKAAAAHKVKQVSSLARA